MRITAAILLFVAAQGASADPPGDGRFNICRSKLLEAQKLHLFETLDWQPPAEPRLVVGRAFFNIGVGAKQGFAETVSCFLTAGAPNEFVSFDLLDPRTGRVVGRFANRRLKMN
jgi:hypothetical protein